MGRDDRGYRPAPRPAYTDTAPRLTGGGWRVPPIGGSEDRHPRGPWG